MSALNKETEITNDLDDLPAATLWHLFRLGEKPLEKIDEEPESESEPEAESESEEAEPTEEVRDWKYPGEAKWKGNISKVKDMYMVSFDHGGNKVRQLYPKKSDARQALLGLNISHGTVKNRYYYEHDYIVYEIVHKGEKFYGKLDLDMEEFLNTHHIYRLPLGYASTLVDGKPKYLHHVVVEHQKGMCVDHLNRNRLDNRSRNLRLCTPRINALNRESTGGIAKRKGGNLYTITYTNDDGIIKQAWFPIDAEDPNGEAEAKARAIRWREKKQRKSLGIW